MGTTQAARARTGPAVSALLHPEMIPAIMKSGRHEIGVHGWIHEFPPAIGSAEEEERLLNQAIEYLTKQTGKRPVGYRAPAWAFSENTLPLIRKAGFFYDSSLGSMDEPYEIVSNGQPTGMVELAIDWLDALLRRVDDAGRHGPPRRAS